VQSVPDSCYRGRLSEVMPMLFMVAGYLKPGAEAQLIQFHNEFNEHLAQPFRNLAAVGALRDRNGKRQGYLGFIEADSYENAEKFLHESPYYQEGLYERVEVFEYLVEVGKVG
jgi:uncharacterized protein YciI